MLVIKMAAAGDLHVLHLSFRLQFKSPALNPSFSLCIPSIFRGCCNCQNIVRFYFIFYCDWLFSQSCSECFPSPNTRRLLSAKHSQVQNVKQRRSFWLVIKAAFISLPQAGAVRFPVSLGQ